MTKKFEFNWQIPVPDELTEGAVFDRWTEEKDNTDLELNCTFKVDEVNYISFTPSPLFLFKTYQICMKFSFTVWLFYLLEKRWTGKNE
jgi:hypothetical protein